MHERGGESCVNLAPIKKNRDWKEEIKRTRHDISYLVKSEIENANKLALAR